MVLEVQHLEQLLLLLVPVHIGLRGGEVVGAVGQHAPDAFGQSLGSRSGKHLAYPVAPDEGGHLGQVAHHHGHTGSHEVAVGAERAAGRGCSAPVVVGDGCWLCTRATVLKGVDIPPQTVVAEGAVVVRSVSDRPGGMWAGVPAKAVARA